MSALTYGGANSEHAKMLLREIEAAQGPHRDFAARVERNRIDDERDVSWNDNRVSEEDAE